MKKILLGLICVALLAFGTPALAQNPQTVKLCVPTSTTACPIVTASAPLPVSGSFSATLAGFTPNGNYTTLTATAASSASTALPAGTVVAFQNLSTVDVSCVLSAGAATATTNKLIVRGGATVYYTVGSNVNAACINQTGSASNVVGLAGGAGLGTAFGGGGSGGGGGAVTMASGAVASGAYSAGSLAAGAGVDGWDLTQGAKADSTCGSASGTCSVVSLLKYLNTQVIAPIPAGNALIGDVNLRQGGTALSVTNGIYSNLLQGNAVLSASNPAFWREVDGTRSRILDPCEANVQSYANGVITSATTTRIITPSASNKTYICSMLLTASAADNVGIVEGTGGTCGTGTAGVIGGTTAANGPNFTANGGLMLQAGGKTAAAQTAGTNVDFCLITSTSGPLTYSVKYVQAP